MTMPQRVSREQHLRILDSINDDSDEVDSFLEEFSISPTTNKNLSIKSSIETLIPPIDASIPSTCTSFSSTKNLLFPTSSSVFSTSSLVIFSKNSAIHSTISSLLSTTSTILSTKPSSFSTKPSSFSTNLTSFSTKTSSLFTKPSSSSSTKPSSSTIPSSSSTITSSSTKPSSSSTIPSSSSTIPSSSSTKPSFFTKPYIFTQKEQSTEVTTSSTITMPQRVPKKQYLLDLQALNDELKELSSTTSAPSLPHSTINSLLVFSTTSSHRDKDSLATRGHSILTTNNHSILTTNNHPILTTSNHPILTTSNHPILTTSNHPVPTTNNHFILEAKTSSNYDLFLHDQSPTKLPSFHPSFTEQSQTFLPPPKPSTFSSSNVSLNSSQTFKAPHTSQRFVPISHGHSSSINSLFANLSSKSSHQTLIKSTPSSSSSSSSSFSEITIEGCKYKILEEIGRGGFSVVYRASSKGLKDFAIKCIHLHQADPCTIRAYHNEVAILHKLKGSPSVIYLYDHYYDKENSELYMVMEKGEGDLKTYFAQNSSEQPAIQLELIKKCWQDMLQAVLVVHDNDIVHWDLKPANFVLGGGRLKVIDFGISKEVLPDQTSATCDQIMGTYNYMSPEAFTNLETDLESTEVRVKAHKKSDVWSLGCILYSMVYGEVPFRKFSDPLKKMAAIQSHDYHIPFPSTTLGTDIVNTIKKCLQRNSKLRPSVRELLYDDATLKDRPK